MSLPRVQSRLRLGCPQHVLHVCATNDYMVSIGAQYHEASVWWRVSLPARPTGLLLSAAFHPARHRCSHHATAGHGCSRRTPPRVSVLSPCGRFCPTVRPRDALHGVEGCNTGTLLRAPAPAPGHNREHQQLLAKTLFSESRFATAGWEGPGGVRSQSLTWRAPPEWWQ